MTINVINIWKSIRLCQLKQPVNLKLCTNSINSLLQNNALVKFLVDRSFHSFFLHSRRTVGVTNE